MENVLTLSLPPLYNSVAIIQEFAFPVWPNKFKKMLAIPDQLIQRID
jgi:hypothetical protein